MEKLSRRSFFKRGALSLGTLVSTFGLSSTSSWAGTKEFKTKRTKENTTICCFCGVGCGLITQTRDGEVINVEGDPNHPINEGSLCSKGAAIYQIYKNNRRNDYVMYRAPKSHAWEKKDWNWAMQKIAQNIRETREKTFIKEENGLIVNRTNGIAQLGGASLDNEECYLVSKLGRALGITYMEHQARI